jgi:hypothetical protein
MLERPLTDAERDELYDVFRRVGEGLAIPNLPLSYAAWRDDRTLHLRRDLAVTPLTSALYARYRAELGAWRYELLRRVQGVLAPAIVADLLGLPRVRWAHAAIGVHRLLRRFRLGAVTRVALVPWRHLRHVRRLDHANASA